MTDEDAIDFALSAVESRAQDHVLMSRGGRVFMALPARRSAAMRTLRLYQPQRTKARLAVCALRLLIASGLFRWVLPPLNGAGGKTMIEPDFPKCFAGSAGVMLGSPEHRVRRAILCYENGNGVEVGKLAFGEEGKEVIDGEAAALLSLPDGIDGVPKVLGVHHTDKFSLLRMPYERGKPFSLGNESRALALLNTWLSHEPPVNIQHFPEWPAIREALQGIPDGGFILERLEEQRLVPTIRHGDFARWNLIRRRDGSVVVLDWEWGHPAGMPGLDLVHFFLQDARLVDGLSADTAIQKTLGILMKKSYLDHLNATGWDDVFFPLLASLTWKHGAGHQDNSEILEAAVKMATKKISDGRGGSSHPYGTGRLG